MIFEFEKIIKNKYNKILCSKMSFCEYKKKCMNTLLKITPLYFTEISEEYIENLCRDNKMQILFFTMGNELVQNDIVSIIIFRKIKYENKTKYYVLCFGTHKKLRNIGYGKNSLDEFIIWISKNDHHIKYKSILVKSVESSLDFYKNYGFINTNLMINKLFFKYEPSDELKNNKKKILEFII